MLSKSLLCLLSMTIVFGAPLSTYDVHSLGNSSATFAANLYKELAKQDGNILVSPSSLQTVLALVQMAASDETLLQMASALGLPAYKPYVEQAFKELLQYNKDVKYSTFSSVNKIFIQNGFDISPSFSRRAVESFDAEIENKDFSHAREATRDINEWVESKTNNKITQLIKEDMITDLTQMVLVNALYFNGGWDEPFEPLLTRPKDFHVSETVKEKVDLMQNYAYANSSYNEETGAHYLELPYARQEFTMTFILPTKGNLSDLENNLHEVLKEQKMAEDEIMYYLPKFKIEANKRYKDVLQNLGMVKAFQTDADLSGFSASKKDLHISHVVQKTFIDVNEEGTEASAASGAIIEDRIFGGKKRTVFRADKPFIFVLRHKQTGIVEFIGRFSAPTS